MTDLKKAQTAISDEGYLAHFMGKTQRLALREGLKGEESAYFIELILAMKTRIEDMPATYQTEGDHVAHLHYFVGGYDAWITEKDMGDGTEDKRQHQAFGLVSYNGPKDGETGYVSLVECLGQGVELDLHWTPKLLSKVRE